MVLKHKWHGNDGKPADGQDAAELGELFREYASVEIRAQGNRFHTMIDLVTTAFSPWPVLFPLRVFSNLLLLVPRWLTAKSSGSTAPSGFLVIARK